jgi:hypothetical protein
VGKDKEKKKKKGGKKKGGLKKEDKEEEFFVPSWVSSFLPRGADAAVNTVFI